MNGTKRKQRPIGANTKVRFEDARFVFDDLMQVSEPFTENNEQRWRTVGRIKTHAVFLVIHTIQRTAQKLSGLSAHENYHEVKGKNMAMVRYREDELPPMTPEREAELKALERFNFEMQHARLSYVCACRSVHLLAQAHFTNSAD